MELRQLGTSDLKIPPIMFGAWAIGGWFWGGTDDKEAAKALQASIDLGLNAIDTAPVYGFGHSERIVARAIKGRREKVIVATKCGLRWDRTDGDLHFISEDAEGKEKEVHKVLKAESIIRECEWSLERLGVEVIDLYQCHWPDVHTPLEETMGALVRLKEQGKIRAIGVSNFTPEMMEACRAIAPLVSDQPKYNLLERDIEADVLPYCRKHSIGVIVYSPIGQGLLTGKVTMDRKFPRGDLRVETPWFAPRNRRRALDALEKARPIAEAHGVTLAQMTINWTIHEPGVTAAIVGARNAKQVEENAGALAFALSDDERASIRKTFEALGGPE